MGVFYGNLSKNAKQRRVKLCLTFVRIIYPLMCIVFVIIFWATGLVYYLN